MTAALGCPRLRGTTAADMTRWAIACRASAAVLDLEGCHVDAEHLRELAAAAERRAVRLSGHHRPRGLTPGGLQ